MDLFIVVLLWICWYAVQYCKFTVDWIYTCLSDIELDDVVKAVNSAVGSYCVL